MKSIFDPLLRYRQSLACLLFESATQRGCLGHAYLLTGSASQDKWLLAQQLASFLNCTADNKLTLGSCNLRPNGCAACQNCQWIMSNQHPAAWISLTGEDTKGGKIGVAKARLLRAELSKTSPFIRVVVIPDASEDTFHRSASAALLKTIEEPGPRCLFLLFARCQQEVSPTVVSRCQIVPTGFAAGHTPALMPGCIEEFGKGGNPCLTDLKNHDIAGGVFLGQDEARTTVDQVCQLLNMLRLGSSQRILNGRSLQLAEELTRLAENEGGVGLVIDLLVKLEVERLRVLACEDQSSCLYLTKLLTLSETAKDQMEHHVPVKPAMESFLLALSQLAYYPT